MASATQISPKSWSAFALSAIVLVLFATFSMWQFDDAQLGEESATPSPQIQTQEPEPVNQAENVAPEVPEAATEKAEIAPEATVKELVQAWNNDDAEKIAALFLPNGMLRLPTGSEVRSRDEIKKTIANHRSGMLSESTLSNTVEGVSNTDDNNSVVKGTYQLEGMKVLGFTSNSTGTYEFRQTKRDGRWLIAQAEVTRE
ncbi:MAG: SgcJ/EcaC family oxidoreductase [Deltaproteobacteria bacterium]|nr:SgcJ/EcaC family oxidoreductase [Deltaproteobacteria bacterium]